MSDANSSWLVEIWGLRVPFTKYGFLSRVACFWSCSCSQKRIIFLLRAGFIVFPGLPLALLFYARALIGRTDGAC